MNKLKTWMAVLALAVLVSGCTSQENESTSSHETQHADSDDHGHGHGSGIVVTHYTDTTELFVEFQPLIQGEESAFAAHLTYLDPQGFRPVNEGKLTVLLSGGGVPDEQATATVSTTPGIFRPILKPRFAGQRHLSLTLETQEGQVTHGLGQVTVYPDSESARAALPQEEASAGIGFTKEQQWKIPFATLAVSERTLRASVAATATLRPSNEREAIIAAPDAGLLRQGAQGFPRIGESVQAGQIVAYLAPKLGAEADIATLRLEVERARIAVEQAKVERERLEGLFKIEAIPQKRVTDAIAREKLVQAELSAARQRVATFSGGNGGIALKSPIAGEIIAVGAIPGAAVTAGQSVVHVADLRRLWLDARVAESEATQLKQPDGAFFVVSDDEAPVVLDVGENATLVASGGLVDPETRTVSVIFEFDNPEDRFYAGMRLQARVYTGRTASELAVPATAVIDDGGASVVFVQREGETFERRVITPGLRDGDWVGVKSGLEPGERVVTMGAYQVRLAATAPASIGHGHAH